MPSSVGYETQQCGSNPASGQVADAGPALAALRLPCLMCTFNGRPGAPGPWGEGATGGAPPASGQGTPSLVRRLGLASLVPLRTARIDALSGTGRGGAGCEGPWHISDRCDLRSYRRQSRRTARH